MLFTDTTGAGADPNNGAGQFAWRSPDPTFQTDVEVFTAEGWQERTSANSRSFSVVNGFSVDWQYSDALETFIIAHHNDEGVTTLTFLDGENLAEHSYEQVNVDGAWAEGPGIVSTPAQHAIDDPQGECGRVLVDLMHASHGEPPQDLVHKGIDVIAPIDCEPEPTPTPTSTPTPTPTPTTTPTPTPTPTPTSTPTPTPTDEPTEDPTEEPTDEPTEEPTDEPTDDPSDDEDDDLPDTGSETGIVAGAGMALLAGAGVLLYVTRLRTHGSA
ncbi:LPXTG cell wall anchor domain-containing protein [Actinobacteria bacterium YIM 96077]|nr:LPXTG cell wall anchor domain-containing protein [Actinobacteria bacterium YIM 96077]